MYGRLHHYIYEWDRTTGFNCDRINYGPIDVSASSWIVPGSIDEDEAAIPRDDEEGEEDDYLNG